MSHLCCLNSEHVKVAALGIAGWELTWGVIAIATLLLHVPVAGELTLYVMIQAALWAPVAISVLLACIEKKPRLFLPYLIVNPFLMAITALTVICLSIQLYALISQADQVEEQNSNSAEATGRRVPYVGLWIILGNSLATLLLHAWFQSVIYSAYKGIKKEESVECV